MKRSVHISILTWVRIDVLLQYCYVPVTKDCFALGRTPHTSHLPKKREYIITLRTVT